MKNVKIIEEFENLYLQGLSINNFFDWQIAIEVTEIFVNYLNYSSSIKSRRSSD